MWRRSCCARHYCCTPCGYIKRSALVRSELYEEISYHASTITSSSVNHDAHARYLRHYARTEIAWKKIHGRNRRTSAVETEQTRLKPERIVLVGKSCYYSVAGGTAVAVERWTTAWKLMRVVRCRGRVEAAAKAPYHLLKEPLRRVAGLGPALEMVIGELGRWAMPGISKVPMLKPCLRLLGLDSLKKLSHH